MKRKTLGAATKHHKNKAVVLLQTVKADTRHSKRGTCGIRLTSLVSATHAMGGLRAHAFRSGGTTAKGAWSPKTVTAKMAKDIYNADADLDLAVQAYRRDCVK